MLDYIIVYKNGLAKTSRVFDISSWDEEIMAGVIDVHCRLIFDGYTWDSIEEI